MKTYSKSIRLSFGFLFAFALLAAFLLTEQKMQAAVTAPAKPVIQKLSRKGTNNPVLTWKKVDGANGYQIHYAYDNAYKDYKSITIPDGSKVSRSISGVSTSKDSYFKVRSYKLVNGVKYFSGWSSNVRLITWNSKWKYAGNSKIHSDSAVLYATRSANKKYKTICINAGHGCSGGSSKKTLCHPDGSSKVTGGSTANGSKYATAINEGTNVRGMSEAAANLKIAMKLKDKLLANGYNVVMVREDGNTQLDNIARTLIANNNAHCHIAIHFDDTTSNKGAFYMSVPNVSSYRNMEPVKSHWKQHHTLGNNLIAGLKQGGIKIWGSNPLALDLTQTSYSTVSSVDIEVGDRGTATSDSNLNKIATGLYYGIVRQYP